MLTPRFKLSQDDTHVSIVVHAPYTNVAEAEVDVDGENFLFVSNPYFLRLRLPGRLIDDESSKGSYICDAGEFRFRIPKETQGEHFENLDMITSLLAPRDIPNTNPTLVEILEEDGITIEEDSTPNDSNKYTYGFANKISSEFNFIGVEFPQIFDLVVPEEVAVDDRNKLRIRTEDDKFSPDHYLADFYDEELIEPYLKAQSFCETSDSHLEFTDDEVAILKEIPNKHYLLSPTEYKQVLLGLVDILFGYCYDKRSTLNESTVESSWTINKLSSTLSWFCNFDDVKEVMVACYRRALIYPIFRNYDLCEKVKGDIVALLKKGKIFLIKCLIDIHQMFNNSSDARYILNQLYIKDYLVFMQKCRSEEIDDLIEIIANVEIKKEELGLDLEELEYAASLVQQEETLVLENEMAVKMASMSLLPKEKKTNGYIPWNRVIDTSSSDSSDSDDSSSDDTSGELDSDSEIDSDGELDSDDDPV